MSFRPMVKVVGEREFVGNALRFATKEEAEANVTDLAWRWTLVNETRVDESSDPVNYAWIDGKLVDVKLVVETRVDESPDPVNYAWIDGKLVDVK